MNNKRPKEIEDILEYIEIIIPAFMFRVIKNYIIKLENFQQSIIEEQERNIDDGK